MQLNNMMRLDKDTGFQPMPKISVKQSMDLVGSTSRTHMFWNMQYFTVNDAKENVIENIGANVSLENIRMHASHAVYLNGIDQSVDLPIANGGVGTYVTYYDPVGLTFVSAAAPLASVYTMTVSFSHYFTHVLPLAQADIDALNANPNLLMKVWFDGAVLPSGFKKSDMVHYIPANEGEASSAFVQDISVAKENVLNPNWNILGVRSSVTDNGDGTQTITGTDVIGSVYGYIRLSATGVSGDLLRDLVPGETVLLCMRIKASSTLAKITMFGLNSVSKFVDAVDVWETYSTVGRFTGSNTSWMGIFPEVKIGESITVDTASFSVEVVSAYEIVNFTSACRSTYANVPDGVSNGLLLQDTTGRAVDIAPLRTLVGRDDGRRMEIPLAVPYMHTFTKDVMQIAGTQDAVVVSYADNTTEILS